MQTSASFWILFKNGKNRATTGPTCPAAFSWSRETTAPSVHLGFLVCTDPTFPGCLMPEPLPPGTTCLAPCWHWSL